MWGIIAVFQETGEVFVIADFEGHKDCITRGTPKYMTKTEAEAVLDRYENSLFMDTYKFELVEEGKW